MDAELVIFLALEQLQRYGESHFERLGTRNAGQ